MVGDKCVNAIKQKAGWEWVKFACFRPPPLTNLSGGCRYSFVYLFVFSLVQENPDIAMDSIVHITQQMNSSKRAELSRILQSIDARTAGANDPNENENNGT